MTSEQVKLVQDSWEKVVPISETAAELFYGRLFELDPAVKPLFKTDIKEQGEKLMQMITTVVRALDKLESIVPAVRNLGRRHVGYGVKDEHYDTVGEALIWTLGKGLGEGFTSEVKESWLAAYGILAETMKAAAAEAKEERV